jgi:hypothetical protein
MTCKFLQGNKSQLSTKEKETLKPHDMFKFETEFELKFVEAKLLLNLGQIYWGFKMVWKNLINFPKFLFALTF